MYRCTLVPLVYKSYICTYVLCTSIYICMYVCSLENLEEVRKKLQERITWYKETVAMIDNSRTFLRVSLEINIFRSYFVNA